MPGHLVVLLRLIIHLRSTPRPYVVYTGMSRSQNTLQLPGEMHATLLHGISTTQRVSYLLCKGVAIAHQLASESGVSYNCMHMCKTRSLGEHAVLEAACAAIAERQRSSKSSSIFFQEFLSLRFGVSQQNKSIVAAKYQTPLADPIYFHDSS